MGTIVAQCMAYSACTFFFLEHTLTRPEMDPPHTKNTSQEVGSTLGKIKVKTFEKKCAVKFQVVDDH